jgi:hypothetical protein
LQQFGKRLLGLQAERREPPVEETRGRPGITALPQRRLTRSDDGTPGTRPRHCGTLRPGEHHEHTCDNQAGTNDPKNPGCDHVLAPNSWRTIVVRGVSRPETIRNEAATSHYTIADVPRMNGCTVQRDGKAAHNTSTGRRTGA